MWIFGVKGTFRGWVDSDYVLIDNGNLTSGVTFSFCSWSTNNPSGTSADPTPYRDSSKNNWINISNAGTYKCAAIYLPNCSGRTPKLNEITIEFWVEFITYRTQAIQMFFPNNTSHNGWHWASERIYDWAKLSAYELGRIFYHMAQRRGFKSNRKAETKESDGVVNTSINELSSQMGERTLGEYFYELWKKGERIRKRYTSREAHYVQEFNAICDFQQIDTELRDKLKRVLFFQRPLRSQKYTVGNCTLEKNKPRAPISHYLFEEYRAWAFINNVKTRMICEEARTEFEPLSAEQKEKLADFLLSKRESFPVTDILKCLYGKQANSYECNYRHNDTVPGSPVISGLKAVFGNNWRDCDINGYKNGYDNVRKILNIMKS